MNNHFSALISNPTGDTMGKIACASQAVSTVVIVDDQSACRATFKRILMTLDDSLDIESFDRPSTALAWCEKNHPALLITDFRLPEIDGIELITKLRKIPTMVHVPIIATTITANKAVKLKALDAGATDFLLKPIDHDECRARCRNLLTLSAYQSSLRWQIAKLHQQLSVADRSTAFPIGLAPSDEQVSVGYKELFVLTSTVAAIEKLIAPLKTTITAMESIAQRPLIGRRTNGSPTAPTRPPR